MSSRIQRSSCAVCGARVIWATFADRLKRTVEECPEGEGSLALQCHLFKGTGATLVEARSVLIRTSYRLHDCPGRSERIGEGAELACLACRRPILSRVKARSVCGPCQRAELEAFEHVIGDLVDRFGRAGVLELLARELAPR